MTKTKYLIIALAVALVSNATLYLYYEGQVEAQTLSKYTRAYTSFSEIKQFEIQENAKGCSKLNTDYTNKDGTEGVLTFTCDSRTPPPVQQRQLTVDQFLDELAQERGVTIIGQR